MNSCLRRVGLCPSSEQSASCSLSLSQALSHSLTAAAQRAQSSERQPLRSSRATMKTFAIAVLCLVLLGSHTGVATRQLPLAGELLAV